MSDSYFSELNRIVHGDHETRISCLVASGDGPIPNRPGSNFEHVLPMLLPILVRSQIDDGGSVELYIICQADRETGIIHTPLEKDHNNPDSSISLDFFIVIVITVFKHFTQVKI